MKKIAVLFLMGILTFAVPQVNAQIRLGVKGGLNISTVHFNGEIISPHNVTGFHIGPMLEATVPLLGVGFETAVLYSQKGFEYERRHIIEDYIDVPVHFKWKFGLPIAKAYLATGPYFGFRVNGDKVLEMPNTVFNQIQAKTFGLGWDIGAGVEVINRLQVGVNYGLGLTCDYSAGGGNKGENRGWMITAAILF